jgi:predicted phosphate transport protein (TIGR00153 family)
MDEEDARRVSFLMPRERRYFVLFREDVDNVMAGITTLHAFLHGADDETDHAEALREIEHRGDEITHTIISELNKSFVTPFDREDILALTKGLDDVVDLAEEVADTIVIDGIHEITPEAQQMGDVLLQIGEELVKAVSNLDSRKPDSSHWVNIHELENQGDKIVRMAIGGLFQNGMDAREIIKWKDVYALLEKTIDRTEDLASIFESIAVKNA